MIWSFIRSSIDPSTCLLSSSSLMETCCQASRDTSCPRVHAGFPPCQLKDLGGESFYIMQRSCIFSPNSCWVIELIYESTKRPCGWASFPSNLICFVPLLKGGVGGCGGGGRTAKGFIKDWTVNELLLIFNDQRHWTHSHDQHVWRWDTWTPVQWGQTDAVWLSPLRPHIDISPINMCDLCIKDISTTCPSLTVCISRVVSDMSCAALHRVFLHSPFN